SVGFLLGLAMIMSTMYPMSKLAKSIVEEKELKMRELMKIMGLKDYIHRLSWFLASFVLFLWIAISSTIIITASFVKASNGLIIFIFYFLFCMTEINLSMLVSVFFSNSKLAAIAAPVVLFALSLPRFVYYSVDPTEEVSSKIATCLLSPAAFAYGADLIAQYEYTGMGIQWYNLFLGPFSFGVICFMLFFDFFIYGFLAWYLDQVLPQEFGTPKHPLFLFLPSYWKRCCRSQDSHDTLMIDDMEDFEPLQPLQVDDTNSNDRIEQLPQELLEQGKVRIKHLGKTFGDGKVAVRDLSLTLLEGQITCLLGHNGAGKSTTIAALTGLVETTRGDVSIYGHLLSKDLEDIRQLTGLW
ncbi:ATP-binding cassette domain-containing protein, partial [archaeon]